MRTLFGKIKIFAAILTGLAAMVSISDAAVGFQPTVEIRSLEVSSFMEPDYAFSAAMYPRTHLPLSPRLRFVPAVETASYDKHLITFITSYARTYKTLPLAVDADILVARRILLKIRQRIAQSAQSTLKRAQEGKRGEGLSVGVKLPKRFDKIFGEGGGNLRVSGYRRITFSGRSSWTDGTKTDGIEPSKFPSLNMEQISRFEITGTIGSKISVKVTQDSQQDIPLANRIQIRYKGDEDDILKSIEAGNTNLNLPNTRFVGYSSRIQGLFGLKAEAQVAGLRLIGIASQEKGSSEKASITASGEQSAKYIRDYQYVENRVYDLAPAGDYDPADPSSKQYLNARDSISVIWVYEQDSRDSLSTDSAIMKVNAAQSSPHDEKMKVKLVENDQYELVHSIDDNYHVIVFNTPLRYAVGISMIVDRYNETGYIGTDTIGNVSQAPMVLRYLQASRDKYNKDHPTWNLMWRNCYRIDKGIAMDQVEIKVFKGLQGREGTSSSLDYQAGGSPQWTYLTLTGLDLRTRQGASTPDDIVDEDGPFSWGPDFGLLIFPSRKPFATIEDYQVGSRRTPHLQTKVDLLYNFDDTKQRSEASEYFLQISTKTRSSSIKLNRANIIEGSERVTLNGQELVRDTDYRIDYDFGTVTLLDAGGLDPNADLQIDFEYAPFLAIQKKTLLGLRAEYELNKDFRFGGTVLYKSDKAQDRKPRVGQETAQAIVLDFDASARLYPQFLTAAVNALPFITTEATSTIAISGEIAQSRPNPNVEGEAYVDDFESSQDEMSLGELRTAWSESSMPALNSQGPLYARSKLIWYNKAAIAWEEVYNSDKAAGEGSIRPLRLVMVPTNYMQMWDSTSQTLGDSIPTRSWAGIQRYFGSSLDASRVQLLEVRLKGESRGKIHFDFGVISEDLNGDGKLNEEPKDGRNYEEDGEDRGYDSQVDTEEKSLNGQPYHKDFNPDPSGDNWWFEGDWPPPVPLARHTSLSFQDSVKNDASYLHYAWVNGTQGNSSDRQVLGNPDSEKLGGSSWEQNNAYFSYSIDLANDEPVSGSQKGLWRTFQIPIRDSLALDAEVATISEDEVDTISPDWARISHVRVWFEADVTDTVPIDIEIADWHFVQANWQDELLSNYPDDPASTFFVAAVSDEDGTYTPPAGVQAYSDPNTAIKEAQSGLALVFNGLRHDDTGMAVKELVSVEQYSGYRRLEMYVHGPELLTTDSLFFFFRIGRDADNYYEYRTYIKSGWNESNYVNMDFNEITALKDAYLRAAGDVRAEIDTTAGKYRIFGKPNLNEIRHFTAAVVNQANQPVAGQIWLDELRVTDVRKDVGTAVRVDVNGTLADLATFNFGVEHRDAFFRGISGATRGGGSNNLGSGAESNSMTAGATMQLHKFLPRAWNANIPISANVSKTTSIPLLRTNSDIVLPDEVREAEKSTSETRRFSIRESFAKKGNNPIFSLLLNRQTVNFSYTRSVRTSVTAPFTFAENYTIKSDFDMSISKEIAIPIFFWTKPIPILKKAAGSKFYLFPKTWRWSGTFNRSLSVTEDLDESRRASFRRDFDGRMNLNYNPFENLRMTYNYSTKRDLTDPGLIRISLKDPMLGLETSYSQSFSGDYDPNLLSFMKTAVRYSADYRDTWDFSSKTRNSTLNRSYAINGDFRHITLLGGKGGVVQRYVSQRSVRGGKATGSEDKDKNKTGRPFYDHPLAALRFLTGWINPVTYNYSRSFNNAWPALQERPSFKYRLGFQDEPEVPRSSNSRNPSAREGLSYDFGSGFSLLSGISTTVKFSRSISRDVVKAGGAQRGESRSTGWPDLGIRISQLDTIPDVKFLGSPITVVNYGIKGLNHFIKVFSPRTGYTRQIKEDFNLDAGFLTSRNETISRNPVLSINLKIFASLSASVAYNTSHTESDRYNQQSGALVDQSRSDKQTIAMATKFSFSAPGGIKIPLLGRLKFKSQVTAEVNIKLSKDKTETLKPGSDWIVTSDKSDLSISPVISYTFSKQIKGGISGRWQDTEDTRRTSHTRQLQIWAEIRF